MPDATVVFNQTLLGQQIRNVTCWNNFRDPEPDLQELADLLRTSWATHLSALQIDGWSLDSVTFIFDDAAPRWSLLVPFTAGPLIGGAASDPVPTTDCVLGSLVSLGPPPNRGRFYAGGFHVNLLGTGGFWSPVARDAVQAMLTEWSDGITTATNQFFLRIARRDAQGFITISSDVDQVVGRLNPATQRRRRQGQGQ